MESPPRPASFICGRCEQPIVPPALMEYDLERRDMIHRQCPPASPGHGTLADSPPACVACGKPLAYGRLAVCEPGGFLHVHCRSRALQSDSREVQHVTRMLRERATQLAAESQRLLETIHEEWWRSMLHPKGPHSQ